MGLLDATCGAWATDSGCHLPPFVRLPTYLVWNLPRGGRNYGHYHHILVSRSRWVLFYTTSAYAFYHTTLSPGGVISSYLEGGSFSGWGRRNFISGNYLFLPAPLPHWEEGGFLLFCLHIFCLDFYLDFTWKGENDAIPTEATESPGKEVPPPLGLFCDYLHSTNSTTTLDSVPGSLEGGLFLEEGGPGREVGPGSCLEEVSGLPPGRRFSSAMNTCHLPGRFYHLCCLPLLGGGSASLHRSGCLPTWVLPPAACTALPPASPPAAMPLGGRSCSGTDTCFIPPLPPAPTCYHCLLGVPARLGGGRRACLPPPAATWVPAATWGGIF